MNRVAQQRGRNVLAVFVLLSALLFSGCSSLKRFAYEGPDRDEWQKPDQVIRSLALAPGQRVADLGAGGGYFTFRLAEAVGPTGRVYAVDVDSNMIEYLQERVQKEGYRSVEVIRAKDDDPLLPESGVDLLFVCNTYHHIQDRTAYFARVRHYLRPNGRIAIVEFNRKGWMKRLFGHSTEAAVIRSEMEAAGYRLAQEFDYLPDQHFLLFSRVAE